MSDVTAEHETPSERSFLKQPYTLVSAGLVALGIACLVLAGGWLWALHRSSPQTPSVAAAPKIPATEQPTRSQPSEVAALGRASIDSSETKSEQSFETSPPASPPTAQTQDTRAEPAPPSSSALQRQAAEVVAPGTVTTLDGAVPDAVGALDQRAPEQAMPEQAAPDPVPAPPAPGKGYRLQLGALRTPERANQEWERLKRQNGDLLGALGYVAARVDLGHRGVFYRIEAGPIGDASVAQRACTEIKRRGVGCILIKS